MLRGFHVLAQDTVRPHVKSWGTTDRRHTNFATESIEQTFNGTVGWNKKVTAQIARNGDLITKAFLEITMTKGSGVTFYPAEAVISDVSLEVGGQTIDKHYGDWFRIFDELYRRDDEKRAYRRLVDFVDGESAGTSKRLKDMSGKAFCPQHLSSAGGKNSCELNAESHSFGKFQKLVACAA